MVIARQDSVGFVIIAGASITRIDIYVKVTYLFGVGRLVLYSVDAHGGSSHVSLISARGQRAAREMAK